MSKILKFLLPAISLLAAISALYFGAELVKRFSPKAPEITSIVQEINDPFVLINNSYNPQILSLTELDPLPTTQSSIRAQKVKELPTVAPDWMTYDGLDLNNNSIKFTLRPICEDGLIAIPEFKVHTWHPEIFESGVFNVGKNTAVAWDHLGYYGLWMHSGLDVNGQPLTAYPLQNYLEIDANGKIRNTDDFATFVQTCLLNSLVVIEQDGSLSVNRISAAVRIPSEDVLGVSQHVMDLVPYLAEAYPESGFDKLKPPSILLYFCGRRLSNETMDPEMNYWTQSRIIIAFEPWEDSPDSSR